MTLSKPKPGPAKKPQPIRKAWKFCPHCGTVAIKPGKHPFICASCGFTHFFGPVSAVGAIAADSSGNVLLLIHARYPGIGMYGLAGGFVDPGETA